MVYQQFINYPTMTVFENTPRHCARPVFRKRSSTRVQETARMLRIEKFLQRYPLELGITAHGHGPRAGQGC